MYKIILITIFLSCPQFVAAQYLSDFRISGGSLSSLSVSKNGDVIITYFHSGGHTWPYGKVYAQRLSNYSNLMGSDFPINTINPSDSVWSVFSRCAIFENGNTVFTWLGTHGSEQYYLIRIFDRDNAPSTNPIPSNDTIHYSLYRDMYDIAVSLVNGNIYHVFSYGVSPWIRSNVNLQKFDSLGNKIGSNTIINDDTLNVEQQYPVITMRQDGSYIIAWVDKRDQQTGSGDIYMQMFDANDNRIGVNRIVNDDHDPWVHHDKPSIASDSMGNFVIAWEDLRINNAYQNIFAQYFNSEGIAMGPNKRVDQGLTVWDRFSPKVSMSSDGNTVIGWTDLDGANPTNVFFRRYNGALNPIGDQRKITNQAPEYSRGIWDIKLQGDRIMTVWGDNRITPPGPGLYYNILSFQNPDSVITGINSWTENILSYELYQNYPNPFNPSTTIKFSLPKKEFVELKMYDLLGREVRTLLSEERVAGTHSITFNAEGLASGVYYYRITSGEFSETRKLILLR